MRNSQNAEMLEKKSKIRAAVDQFEQLPLFIPTQISLDTVLLHPVQIVITNKYDKSASIVILH